MTTNVQTKAEKAARMAAIGYIPAKGPGRCCLCSKGIGQGQYIGKMPGGWQPKGRLRWAHYREIERLKDQIRARAGRLGTVGLRRGQLQDGSAA